MTDNDQAGSAQAGPAQPDKGPDAPQAADDLQAPDDPQAADDPGYLEQTGEAVGEDGSVVPIIGGLPAVEGSAWDIGAPRDERGADLAEELRDRQPDHGDHEDTPGG